MIFTNLVPIGTASECLNEWADEDAGIEAVQRILDALDDVSALQDSQIDPDVLISMLRDSKLHAILQVGTTLPCINLITWFRNREHFPFIFFPVECPLIISCFCEMNSPYLFYLDMLLTESVVQVLSLFFFVITFVLCCWYKYGLWSLVSDEEANLWFCQHPLP